MCSGAEGGTPPQTPVVMNSTVPQSPVRLWDSSSSNQSNSNDISAATAAAAPKDWWHALMPGQRRKCKRGAQCSAPACRELPGVLVADDNPVNRAIVLRALARAGFYVVSAEDGRQAFALYATSPEDIGLVIMDIEMPGTGGVESAALIRSFEAAHGLRRVPIFAWTSALDEYEDACRIVGMNGAIDKPCEIGALEGFVTQVCAGAGGTDCGS
eukprot:Opistho-1_new@28528